MQVWKHLQKQLPGSRGSQQADKELPPSPSASSTSSVCLSDSTERRTSASTFYIAFSDDDNDKSEISIMSTKSSKHCHIADSNSAQSQSHTATDSHTDSERNPPAADVHSTILPKLSKPKKPLQRQQLVTDGAADSQKHKTALVMRSKGTIYPPPKEPAPEAPSTAAKPMPPVCY